jgi:transcription antitermination factor NusG
MAKQTAVEWLVEQMEKDSYQILFGKLNASNETIEQAKSMEKEQITQAHLLGLLSLIKMEATKQAEQYYDETYNN